MPTPPAVSGVRENPLLTPALARDMSAEKKQSVLQIHTLLMPELAITLLVQMAASLIPQDAQVDAQQLTKQLVAQWEEPVVVHVPMEAIYQELSVIAAEHVQAIVVLQVHTLLMPELAIIQCVQAAAPLIPQDVQADV